MSKKFVYLIPERDAGGKVQWTMVHEDSIATGQGFPLIDLPEKGGPHDIVFKILDVNGLGLTFDTGKIQPDPTKPPVTNAIWIVEGSGSQKIPGIHSDQIKNALPQNGAKQLKVKDDNSGDEMVLTYQLNFRNPSQPTEQVTAIDPEIRNGGGTQGISWFSLETAAVLMGLALLAVIGLQWVTQARHAKARKG